MKKLDDSKNVDVLVKENNLLKKEKENYEKRFLSILFLTGEMLSQISFQIKQQEIPETEMKTNCYIIKMIGDLLKSKIHEISNNTELENELFEKICMATGRTEPISFNEANLLRLADSFFVGNYKERIVNSNFDDGYLTLLEK